MAPPLPTEVWEHVLDLLEDSWSDDTLEEENVDEAAKDGSDDLRMVACQHRYSMFTACALVCQAWLPCSRIHLYHLVYVSDASQVASLVRTIAEQPWLGGLVRELEVTSEARPAAYLPFAHGTLAHHLCNVRSLKLSSIDFRKNYPPRYHTLLARYPVRELTLSECNISVVHLFHLLWSLPTLDALSLLDDSQDGMVPGFSEFELLQLEQMQSRRYRSCPNLRSLTISAPYLNYDQFPPRGAFGDAVRSLSLVNLSLVPGGLEMSDKFLMFVSQLPNMASLGIAFARGGPGDWVPTPKAGDHPGSHADESLGTEQERSFIATLVNNIHAHTTFSELTVTLPYGRNTKTRAVEEILFNPALEAALERFEHFSRFNIRSRSNWVSLFERTTRRSAGRTRLQVGWHPDVVEKMPGLRKKIIPPGSVLANFRAVKTNSADQEDGIRPLLIQCHIGTLVFHPKAREYLHAFHLTAPHRLIFHTSKMVYLGTDGLAYDVLVLLLDHCVLIAEAEKSDGTTLYHVDERPIPLTMLNPIHFEQPAQRFIIRPLSPTDDVRVGERGREVAHSLLYPCDLRHCGRSHTANGLVWAESAETRYLLKVHLKRTLTMHKNALEYYSVFEAHSLISDTFLRPWISAMRGLVSSSFKITCSAPFDARDGRKMVALGDSGGVSIWDITHPSVSHLHIVLPHKNVTQCSVVEQLGIMLVLANNWLILYSMKSMSQTTHWQTIPRIDTGPISDIDAGPIELLSDVQSFRIGALDNGDIVVCVTKMPRLEMPRLVLTHLASLSEMWNPTSFPILGEYDLPFANAADVALLKGQLVVMSATSFEFAVMDLSLTKLNFNDTYTELVPFTVPKGCAGCFPLGVCFPSDDELLLCYSGFGLYLTWDGRPSCPNNRVEWEGQAKSVAFQAPYILLFGTRHIEVRHMRTGRLVQIIAGDDIQCLYSGRDVTWDSRSKPANNGTQGHDEESEGYIQGLSGARSGHPCVFELRLRSAI